MKFFFPDAHDLVDPSFNFDTEQRQFNGSRQLAQLYAHERLDRPPYDGMLISKAMVDGRGKSLRYSFTQVQKLKRLGAREFLRLDRPHFTRRMETMGDCGSFSYLTEPTPPFSVDEVIEFYLDAQFDYGISLDHVILGYDEKSKSISEAPEEWRGRFEITLQCAKEFFSKCQTRKVPFCPVGAAQGWSPQSYAVAVSELQKMGYHYIALGGMVPLKSREILACLEAVNEVRNPRTKLHLLGINRLEALDEFARMGVHSFDSTSALKKAFMDDKDNYHTKSRAYTAVRVPQVGENAALKKKILAGTVDHARARFLEKTCMDGLKALGQNNIGLTEVLGRLREYDILWRDGRDETERYRETLQDAPWRKCSCSICRDLGVHVVIFRGADRNRSRGFHNLHVLSENLREWTARNQPT